jgi:hypothetical protein
MTAGQGDGRKHCRPFAAGALIALAGPFLGSIPLLMLFQYAGSAQPYASAYGVIKSFPTVAQGILSNGWVSLRYWLWLTVLLAAVLPLVFLFGGFSERSVSLDAFAAISIALFFLASTLFASLVLRTAIIRLGWMKPPSQTGTAV